MKRIHFGFLLSVMLMSVSFSQQFTELSSVPFTEVWFGSAGWGDYDNDDDLDIILTGLTSDYNVISKLYRNDGNNIFTEQTSISFTGVFFSSMMWGDYNNDGNLDILITGNTSIGSNTAVSKVYRNDGNNSFTEQTSISLTGVYQGSAAWCDYDNDGDMDIFLSGQSANGAVSKIYRNSGSAFSEQTSIQITGVKNSSAEWGDYDNDGDMDLLLTGVNASNRFTKIYRNNGNNSFSEQTSISLIGVCDGSAKWGDYDNDGDLDIILTGSSGNNTVTKLYRNNGNNSFSEQSVAALAGAYYSSVDWADYDNDGYLDIFLTGASNNYPAIKSRIYQNAGNNYFSEQTSISLTNIFFGCSAWGDYDNDGDLDLLIAGNSGDSIVTKLYINNNLNQNTRPTPPGNLTSIVSSQDVIFRWNKSVDFETPSKGLKYNLVIGTTTNGVNIISPMSNRINGYRRAIDLGNVNHDTSWTIKGLPNGNYYWSVQSIDNSFSGSNFSTEQNFLIDVPFTEQTSISLTGVLQSSIAWGDYDNDDDLDILLTGSHELDKGISRIYRNDGLNTFTEQKSILLTGVYYGSAAWGDYDNDDDLDILLTGSTSLSGRVSKVYKNNGDNTFTDQTSISLIGVSESSIAWGDYDNDGDLDILLTGNTGNGYVSKIYRNNGNDTFTEQTSISIIGVAYSSVAWGDYDNDGDLDILITGNTGTNNVSKIYRNEGNNRFSEQNSILLTGVGYSAVAWGDYDNDGYLDILMTGFTSGTRVSKIYRNNGDETFTEQTSIPLSSIYNGSVAWGDYDNDGYLDIILTGNAESGIISKIYRNIGDNSFADQASISLAGVWVSSAGWADYDADGDLDLFLFGSNDHFGYNNLISKIYRNNNISPNNPPSRPTNLSLSVNGNAVTFGWNKSSDIETPSNGLKYNLVITSATSGLNVMSPMSNRNNGYRKIISLGNANQDTSWTIRGLSKGIYSWSVQAIDNAFAGSDFAFEQNFEVGGVRLLIEGLYDEATNRLSMRDTVKAYLRNIFTPFEVVDSTAAVIDSISFIGNFRFLNATSGTYYLVIKHRNSIETWSEPGGVHFTQGTLISYDFTKDSTKAYGSNMVKKGSKWCIYSGDVNQDGLVDIKDVARVNKAVRVGLIGYSAEDLNGDNIVDASDLLIVTTNSNSLIRRIAPSKMNEDF